MKRANWLILAAFGWLTLSACQPADPPGTNCADSAACDALDGMDGQLCVESSCTPCDGNAACAADPHYGAGAQCVDGKCEACTPGDVGCACLMNGDCQAGATCQDNTCVACTAGEPGCVCHMDDTCDGEFVCSEGVCVTDPCPAGTADCACEAGNNCDDGLVCGDDSRCHACTPDVEGCPCDDAGACVGDLVCGDDTLCRAPKTCENAGCVPEQQCDEGASDADAVCLEACNIGYLYDPVTSACVRTEMLNCQPEGTTDSILAQCTMNHRLCVEADGSASCGACETGFTEVAGVENCRAVITCTDHAATCAAQNKDCVEAGPNTDAVCGACIAGYVDDGGACVPEPDAHCRAGELGAINDMCAAQNRYCEEHEDTPATCGDCLPGTEEPTPGAMTCQARQACSVLGCDALNRSCGGEPFAQCEQCFSGFVPSDPTDPNSVCRPRTRCTPGLCGADEYCDESDPTQDAQCVARPCTGAQDALNEATGECVTCGMGSCGNAGETGRVWPFTRTGSNQCICETLPGFYMDTSNSFAAEPCDADGDGWVRDAARGFIESNDEALRANARCDLHTADRFVLQNEIGQERVLMLCDDQTLVAADQVNAAGDAVVCANPGSIDLYESSRNDDRVTLDAAVNADVPTRGARRPVPAELNPLTKACASSTADMNHNNIADIAEAHDMSTDGMGLSADEQVFLQLSYFSELYSSFYRPPAQGAMHGAYVITERSRCDGVAGGVPLSYDGASAGSDYWRECTRMKPRQADTTTEPGFDFVGWTCHDPAGEQDCYIGPPTEVRPAGMTVEHGLCNAAVRTEAASLPWRGMLHASQFRCMQVDSSFASGPLVTEDGQSGSWNTCVLPAAEPTGAGQPALADVSCGNSNPNADEVGFLAIAQKANPEQGCIAEADTYDISYNFAGDRFEYDVTTAYYQRGDMLWNELCPGVEVAPNADTLQVTTPNALGKSLQSNFGSIVCGCTTGYGGLSCEIGCPDQQLHEKPGTAAETLVNPRAGYWMCGNVSRSYMPAADGQSLVPGFFENAADDQVGYVVRGQVPAKAAVGDPLCENADCATGYTIR